MKKWSILLLALVSFWMSEAQQVNFRKLTWQEANDLAAQENKYIFVDAYTEWCGWCKVMDKEMFTDPAVFPFINENFIPMKIDFEDTLGILLSMKFRVWAYPTTMIFNPQGQYIGRISGYNEDHGAYLASLKKFTEIKEDKVFGYDSHVLDPAYPEFYVKSFGKGKREWPKQDEVSTYLKAQPDLYSEVSWSVILRFHPKEYLDYVIENREEYIGRYGKEEVTEIIQYYIFNIMQDAVKLTDRAMLDKALKLCDYMDDPESFRFYIMMAYYEQTKDWPAFTGELGSYISRNGYEFPGYINNYCWMIYENVDDREILLKAVEWMKKVIEVQPISFNLDTYAALLYKTGDLEEADNYADQAIEAAKKEGQDYSSTKELKEKIRKAKKEK